jgi:hypothetical protein
VFIKTSTRTNRDGSKVRYLQLAHNEWDPVRQTARTKMLYSFGRADQLDRAAVERLIGALSRLLGTKSPPADGSASGVPGLEYVESRPLGGTWLLDQLWHRLRIDTSMKELLAGTRVNGHLRFPAGGQEISPVVAMDVPMDGHEISPLRVRWPGA